MTTRAFLACWFVSACALEPPPSTSIGWRRSGVLVVRPCIAPCCVYNAEADLEIRYPLMCNEEDGGVR